MAIREVVRLGDPRLREPAKACETSANSAGIEAVIEDLRDTLAHRRRETGYRRGIESWGDACLNFLCNFMQVERHRAITGRGRVAHSGVTRPEI